MCCSKKIIVKKSTGDQIHQGRSNLKSIRGGQISNSSEAAKSCLLKAGRDGCEQWCETTTATSDRRNKPPDNGSERKRSAVFTPPSVMICAEKPRREKVHNVCQAMISIRGSDVPGGSCNLQIESKLKKKNS